MLKLQIKISAQPPVFIREAAIDGLDSQIHPFRSRLFIPRI